MNLDDLKRECKDPNAPIEEMLRNEGWNACIDYIANRGIIQAWQDIETAPKNGITILVWHKDYEYGAGVSLWSDTYEKFMVGNNRPQPTHWMPLLQRKQNEDI